METKTIKITPAIARTMLSKNSINRPLKQMTVDIYTREMMAGLWREETGESIKFATDGSLLDGQHRLHSVINSNATLNFLVVENLDKEIFKFIDTGTKRTPGDVFYTAGYSNGVRLASGLRKYYLLKIEQTHHSKAPSNGELIDLYLAREKFWNAAATMSNDWYRKERLLTTSDFMGFYAYFYDIDQGMAFEFMEKLGLGDNLNSDSPIKLLRNKLILGKSSHKFKLSLNERSALIIKTWNYFRKNVVIKNLVFSPKREEFPIAI